MKEDADEVAKRIGSIYPEGSEVLMTLAEQFREEGKQEGEAYTVKKIALEMLKKGSDIDFIAEVNQLETKEIKKLKGQKQ
jgi:predicted transposase YdaD